MNKADKQRLINAVLEKNPNCTECGKLIKNYQFEYEPKFMPLDAAVNAKRGDNSKKWVMCYECAMLQSKIKNISVKKEASLMIEENSIKQPSIKEMTLAEIKNFLHKQNLAVNILLGRYEVPKDVITEVKKVMRSEFHINYFLKNGKFLTEK